MLNDNVCSSFSTIQYNTTVKLTSLTLPSVNSFSTIQYNTTVKHAVPRAVSGLGFSTIQYNTTVKRQDSYLQRT